MKNVTLISLALCLLSVSTAQSQIRKGAVLLGSEFGYASYKQEAEGWDDMKQNAWNISPNVAFAIRDNLLLGADLTYSQAEPIDAVERKVRAGGLGVYLRRYWGIAGRFYVFGQARLGGELTKDEQGSNGTTKGFSITGSLYPGISYGITSKIYLETGFNNLLTIGYTETKLESGTNPPSAKTRQFAIASSLSQESNFSVGIRFLLGK